MADDKKDSPKSENFFRKLLYNEEYRSKNPDTSKKEDKTETVPTNKQVVDTGTITNPKVVTSLNKPEKQNPVVSAGMPKGYEDKMFSILEQMNQPGIDFWELWAAARRKPGGLTKENVNEIYDLFAIADPTLTKEKFIESGNYYRKRLSEVVNSQITSKKEEQQTLSNEKQQESAELERSVRDLDVQIRDLETQRDNAKQALLSIDGKYDPDIRAAEDLITDAQKALALVIGRMDDAMHIIDTGLSK